MTLSANAAAPPITLLTTHAGYRLMDTRRKQPCNLFLVNDDGDIVAAHSQRSYVSVISLDWRLAFCGLTASSVAKVGEDKVAIF